MKNLSAERFISPLTMWSVIITGVVLRFAHLWENRSLWLDEAYLALNILESTVQQLWHHQPIILEQAKAPLLFSFMVRGMAEVFGSGEMVLRTVPFVAGAAAVYIFYRLCRNVLSAETGMVALILFSLCDRLIYYAAELKPYSTDVCVTVVLYLLYDRIRREPDERRHYIVLAVTGFAAIWLSFPAIIVLAAIGLVTWLQAPRGEKTYFLLIGCFWLLNIGMVYKFAVQPMLASDYITGSIAEHFPPAPVWTASGALWLGGAWTAMFADPLGQPLAAVGSILILAGTVSLWRRDRGWCAVLVLTVILTVTAALLGKYPFFKRHLLFLIPALFMLMAQGLTGVARLCGRAALPVAMVLAAALILKPLYDVSRALLEGREWQHNRPVMEFMTARYRPGDGIYMNNSAQYMFAYYLDRSGREKDFLQPLDAAGTEELQGLLIGKISDGTPEFSYEILVYDRNGRLTGKSYIGRPELGVIRPWTDVATLTAKRGERNWLVFSHADDDVKSAVYGQLERDAVRLDFFSKPGAEAVLFQWKD